MLWDDNWKFCLRPMWWCCAAGAPYQRIEFVRDGIALTTQVIAMQMPDPFNRPFWWKYGIDWRVWSKCSKRPGCWRSISCSELCNGSFWWSYVSAILPASWDISVFLFCLSGAGLLSDQAKLCRKVHHTTSKLCVIAQTSRIHREIKIPACYRPEKWIPQSSPAAGQLGFFIMIWFVSKPAGS